MWRIAVSDVTERREATEFLRQLTDELERRVDERTESLNATNRQLLVEIAQRRRAEALLRDREELLERRVEERTRTLQSLLDISPQRRLDPAVAAGCQPDPRAPPASRRLYRVRGLFD